MAWRLKLYSNRIAVSPEMETTVTNLFTVGDGPGITRGLLQASASGIIRGAGDCETNGKQWVGTTPVEP